MEVGWASGQPVTPPILPQWPVLLICITPVAILEDRGRLLSLLLSPEGLGRLFIEGLNFH